METVRLSRDGRLTDRNGNPVEDVFPELPRAFALDEDCTLRSFLALLARHPSLQKLSEFLPAAVADMEKCPPSGCLDSAMPCLVIGKTMELIGFPGRPRAELYIWLRGLSAEAADGGQTTDGGQTAEAGDDGRTDEPAGGRPPLSLLMEADREIRFIPLQFLLDTPLYLGGLKHVVLGDANRHLYCESRFTFFEVIDGLAWELGFQGGTKQCSIER